MYQLVNLPARGVVRLTDGAFIPDCNDNADWLDYQIWLSKGNIPVSAPPPFVETYVEKRQKTYPSIPDQLDMIYWDTMNKTTKWVDEITRVKNLYPKPTI